MSTPQTDPFWIGDPFAPLSAYTPSVHIDRFFCCPRPIPTVNVEGLELDLGDIELNIDSGLMDETNALLSAACEKDELILSALNHIIQQDSMDNFTPIQ